MTVFQRKIYTMNHARDNIANSFLVELSEKALWPFTPAHLTVLSSEQRTAKLGALIEELKQVIFILKFFEQEDLPQELRAS